MILAVPDLIGTVIKYTVENTEFKIGEELFQIQGLSIYN